MKLLSKGPISVLDISDKLELSFKSVSKHLQKLEREGIVGKKRDGKFVYYKLTDSFVLSGVCRQIIKSK